MAVSWVRDGDTLYGMMDGGAYRLIVEALPDRKGWDWAVWRQEQRPELVACGTAPTADAAIDQAEACVGFLPPPI